MRPAVQSILHGMESFLLQRLRMPIAVFVHKLLRLLRLLLVLS